MNYILVLIADILLAANFICQKKFQNLGGNSNAAGILYSLIIGVSTAMIFFIINGFKMTFTLYSVFMAGTQAVLVTLYTLISFSILKKGNLTLYTLFLMTGGMVLPYIFGVIFLNEDFTVIRSVGLFLITVAVVLSNSGVKKPSKMHILLCILVFCINGFVSIVSKIHQIETDLNSVNPTEFVFLTGAIKAVMCLPIYFILNRKTENENSENKVYKPNLKKVLPIAFMAALFSGVSYMLQLIGASKLPATVVYPFITGGSIIFSTLAEFIILKEKPTKEQIIGIAICFVGTLLFL